MRQVSSRPTLTTELDILVGKPARIFRQTDPGLAVALSLTRAAEGYECLPLSCPSC